MNHNFIKKRTSLFHLLALCLITKSANSLEVGTNCLGVTCEIMEGKCCDRSDLELKVTLADNCCMYTQSYF